MTRTILQSSSELLTRKRNAQGGINFQHLRLGNMPDVVGEYAFGKADQIIAEDGAVVLQPLVGSDFDLRRKTAVSAVDRSAYYAGETFINTILPGNDEENPLAFRITSGALVDQVQVAASHSPLSSRNMVWYESTSSASALSSSAYFSKSSLSRAADFSGVFATAGVGVKEIVTLPAGTSLGTSIVRGPKAGISKVCVMVISKV